MALREAWRSEALADFAQETRGMKWTRRLFVLLLEELYISDEFDEIVGCPNTVPPARYPQAVAVAIALRHSWRSDDLASIAQILNLRRIPRQ
jgi:hypothetical protein